jgi:hypothetical protein
MVQIKPPFQTHRFTIKFLDRDHKIRKYENNFKSLDLKFQILISTWLWHELWTGCGTSVEHDVGRWRGFAGQAFASGL